MLAIFTDLADWLVYGIANFSPTSNLGQSLHFFVEDTSKILVLLIVMIYIIAFLRASLNVEAVRNYLQNRHRFFGYLLGSLFGAITPFCSCSSIPLFLGFTTARIPVGITMAFLITSPMINEVAIVLLGSILGWKFTLIYVVVGIASGMVGGLLLDLLKAERYLQPFLREAIPNESDDSAATGTLQLETMNMGQRHQFAKDELVTIVKRIWKWVFIGVGAGAALHGFVPDGWISATLGAGQWWTVPAAVLLGIPLYSNATGIIPVIESLLEHGLPIGTAMALMMSTVAASFPEFVMLKQVMQWRLLGMFFIILLILFTCSGWLFNLLWL